MQVFTEEVAESQPVEPSTSTDLGNQGKEGRLERVILNDTGESI